MQDKNSIGVWKFIPPREKAKLLLMLIALIVLVGAMFGLLSWVDRGQPQPAEAIHETAGRSESGPPDYSAIGELKEGEGPAVPEPETPADADEAEIYDPDILKDIKEDRTENAPFEALVLLLHRLQGKTHKQLADETRTDIFVEQLLKNPGEYRGEPVYVDGTLEEVRKFPLWTNATGIELLYFGKLKQTGEVTRTVCFYLIDGPLGAKIGERVVLRGYFLSLYKHKRSDEISPIVVGKRFDPPPWLTDRASLDNVFDGDFNREHHAVYYCLNEVMGTSPAQIAAAVDTKITPEDMKTSPAKIRGKFVSFGGTIIQLRRQTLEPNPTGLSECFVGYLLNTKNQACMFYITDSPEGLEEKKLARIDGIFMKNYRYVTRKSLEREAPVIIGRALTPASPQEPSGLNFLIVGICAAAFVALAAAAIMEARATRRRLTESRERTIRRMPGDLSARAKEAARKAKGKQDK